MAAEVKSPAASAAGSGAVAGEPDLHQAVPTTTKTYLVTLPQELILDIIKLCVPPRPLYNRITVNRTITILQLSLVDKSLREMCVPILFRTLKLSTDHVELLGHIQVLENSRVLEIVQHLKITSTALRDATPQWERDTPSRLAGLLGRMPNLKDLSLSLQSGEKSLATAVQDELVKQCITIRTVKRFNYDISFSNPDPSPSVSFIASIFMGLRALHLDLRAVTSLKTVAGLSTIARRLKLRKLSLHNYLWTSQAIKDIHKLFPKITSLIVGGEVFDVAISELVPTFKKFRNLRSLAVTDLVSIDDEDLGEYLWAVRAECECEDCFTNDDMDLVWDEGQEGACDCEDCSFTGGHYGEALDMAREHHPLAEDQKENVRDILRECPDLEVLYFQTTWAQATRYKPVRDDSGLFVRFRHKELVDWPGISKELSAA
ncbi:hypothetical protein CGCSCA4_v005151 [Colletotrichum siamense]|uniref:Uncharacterized protein n=1 Tax=Colletotrichum siamense TaxID=690259 RepID=A0A9P5EWW0_COLSI|nr:hypothetical protein CGCSCA4_v005151 [Colletotrichum siamense]KAF4861309.1 hypothetical protein CGCSCA2_v004613 [Colletotrichum siamense]